MVTFTIPAAQTLQEILTKSSARGLQNLHRAVLLHALQAPLKIFDDAREGLITEYATKDTNGLPISPPSGGVLIGNMRAFQKALDDLVLAQAITLDPAGDPHLRDGLLFAKTVVSSDACPTLDGTHAFNFKLVYDALQALE